MSGAPHYLAHLRDTVLPQLRSLNGFRGVCLQQRMAGPAVELIVTTRWDSMEAVRSFAGDDPDVAVVEPAAAAVLASFDSTVAHYEVMLDA